MNFEVGPRLTAEQRAAQLARAECAVAQRRRRRLLASAGLIGGGLVGGLFLIGWALHTTDNRWAGVAFWSGLLLGNVAILVCMLVVWGQDDAGRDG